MATTYEAIATVTVGSGGASSISFTSIAADWTDLILLYSGRSTTSGTGWDDVNIGFNGQAANTSVTVRNLFGYGTTVGSNTFNGGSFGVVPKAGNTASTFGNTQIYIPNYAGSNNKSFSVEAVSEDNSSSNATVSMVAGLWSNTSAITQLTMTLASSANFAQYSTATLYGIKNS